MIRSLNVWVAVCLVAVGPGLSAAFAAPTENPFDRIDPVDVSFAGTLARAQQGSASAQFALGSVYAIGQDVPQDYAAAVSWFRKAADKGYDRAQASLGFMYSLGRGVPKDFTTAANWYLKAAEQGNAMAQNNLGGMYDYGEGVPQDYVQAHKWYNLAGAGAEVAEVRDQAIKSRDIAAAKMQPAQIAEAQRLASAWRRK